jgi:hypothetical protein
MTQPVSVREYWYERETDVRRQLESVLPGDLATRPEPLLRRGKPYAESLVGAAEQRADVIVLGIHASRRSSSG